MGRARLRFPLAPALERRFDALSGELDWRQLGTALDGKAPADERFALARPFPLRMLDGPLWYLRLPARIARELRRFGPEAVIAQGAQETALALLARRLARSDTAVVLDLHGDWRAPTRLYGSRARRLLDPVSDALARRALRGATGVRTISEYTSELVRAAGIEPAAEFPAFMDLAPFTAQPVAPPAGGAARALRRRARAVQGVRRARRRVAARGGARTRLGAARGRRRDARSARGGPRRGASGTRRVDAVAPGRRSRSRSRRVHAARPALALGGDGPRRDRGRLPRDALSSGAASGGSRTSSRTARPESSSRRETPARSRTRSSASCQSPSSRNASAPRGVDASSDG